MAGLSWNDLPAEMKYAVVQHLTAKDIAAFANSCRDAYALSIPRLYREVRLQSYEILQVFLRTVPISYCRYVRVLSVDLTGAQCTLTATADLSSLLDRCSEIEDLDLRTPGLLDASIVPYFRALYSLQRLSISNCSDDQKQPLSERLIVSIAASIPNIGHLVLDRICRSAIHAPELLGAYPFVPVVRGDEDVPAHSSLGDELSLPSLLLIPTLKELRIRDTHLGDARWATISPKCQLQTLEIGSCCYESPEFNRNCAERIIDNAGRSVEDLTLSAALSSDVRTTLQLKRLKKLRTTSLLPIENLAETLIALSDSPVETLALECHEDDIEDQCFALEDFITGDNEANKRPFYARLRSVSLSTVQDILTPSPTSSPIFALTVEEGSRDPSSAVHMLQEHLEKAQCINACASIDSSEAHAFTTAMPCRPVQPIIEQMTWPNMMEAW